jgi:ABC-type bacteriocin/lantibiotic exporter with double-glycine peptidase domain
MSTNIPTLSASLCPGSETVSSEQGVLSDPFPAGWGFLRRLGWLLAQEGRAWVWISGAALAEALVGLSSPYIASSAMDQALPNSAPDLLRLLAIGVALATAHAELAGWVHARVRIVLQQRCEVRCLRDVLARVLAAPYAVSRLVDSGTASETAAAASDVSLSLVRALVDMILQGCSVLAVGTALLLYSPALAFASVVIAGPMLLGSLLFALREGRCAQRVQTASIRRQGLFHTLLRALPMLRVAGATPRLVERWANGVRAQVFETVREDNARLLGAVWLQSGGNLAALTANIWLTSTTLSGATSLGTLLTCTLLMQHFQRTVTGVATTLATLLALRPRLELVQHVFDQPRAQERRLIPEGAHDFASGSLRLDKVWFRYERGGRWILENHDCEFAAGEYTLLRAPSGTGKTTVLRLLAGLQEPEHGSVSVLGHNPMATRGLVTYLPQQAALLEMSIAANLITLSSEPLERSLRIAHLTGLSDLLARLPMGAETLLSANGGNLSAGQRQLILLTAAFATRRPVVLLDEAVSQLDEASLARIDWPTLTHGRTVIAVQHA